MASRILGLLSTTKDMALSGFLSAIRSDFGKVDEALAGVAGPINLLTNPGFEVWQRGSGAFTANNAYTADRWQIALGTGSSMSVSRGAASSALSSYELTGTYTHVTGVSNVQQSIENWAAFKGQTVTYCKLVKASVANKARIFITDGLTVTYSSYHPGGGVYALLSVTKTLSASATELRVGVQLEASMTFALDNASLVLGTTALPYAPLTPGEDLRRCKRYYERIGASWAQVYGYSDAGGTPWFTNFQFEVEKAVTPTVTRQGTWVTSNITDASTVIGNITTSGFAVSILITAAGFGYLSSNSLNNFFEVIANP